MIELLSAGFENIKDSRERSRKKYLYSTGEANGTWIILSPQEILPEKYLPLINENKIVRELYNVPDSWTIIKVGEGQFPDMSLYYSIKNEIYSFPGDHIIKEYGYIDGFIWGVASKDLNYPKSYNPEILKENPWIKKGGWSLFCIGRVWNEEERKKARELFKKSLPPNVIYEEIL